METAICGQVALSANPFLQSKPGDKYALHKQRTNRSNFTLMPIAGLGKGGGLLEKPVIEKTAPGCKSEFDLRHAIKSRKIFEEILGELQREPNTIATCHCSLKRQITLKRTCNGSKVPVVDPSVLWTYSITSYCQKGRLSAAVLEFIRMRLSGVEPNDVTFLTFLSGCAHFPAKALCFGVAIHGYILKLGLDRQNVMVGTALIDMYSKFGQMGPARLCFDHMDSKNEASWNTLIDGYMRIGNFQEAIKLFDEMPERDAISFTALIGGFVKIKRFEDALEWFKHMQLSGVQPDSVTLISVLSAVANLGTHLGLGLWLHKYVLEQYYRDNIRVNNAFIDMYCRCGSVELAHQVFQTMPRRSLVSWNSIIVGFAMNGHAEESLEHFNLLQSNGFEPDGVSFTGALTACSHAGLVNEGLKLFVEMKKVHKISPRIEHYGCLVDLYSRAGRLEDAMQVVEHMPMKPNEIVLGSLLAACRAKGALSLAERIMNYIYELDPGRNSNHVLLSNLFAALGSWQGANNVRKKMKALGIQKRPGISSIEVNCIINEFVAGDKSHVETQSIYSMLDLLSLELRISGYASEIDLTKSWVDD